MKISVWVIGKSQPKYIESGVNEFKKRLSHYINFSYKEYPNIKGRNEVGTLLKKESELILKNLKDQDTLILLDEKGKQHTSMEFANFINQKLISNTQHLVFLVGGAYGFDDSLYNRSQGKISLGKGTYSHQLIRVMFLEQLYRGFTILRGEKYHNE